MARDNRQTGQTKGFAGCNNTNTHTHTHRGEGGAADHCRGGSIDQAHIAVCNGRRLVWYSIAHSLACVTIQVAKAAGTRRTCQPLRTKQPSSHALAARKATLSARRPGLRLSSPLVARQSVATMRF